MVLPEVTEPLNEYSLDGTGETGLEEAGAQTPQESQEGVQLGPDAAPPAPTETTPQPAPAPAPEPEPESAPTVSVEEFARLQAENARLATERQEHQRQAQTIELQNRAVQLAAQNATKYINQGLDQQTAQQMGNFEAAADYYAAVAEQANLRATAIELSYQYNVPREQLHNFPNEAAMRAYVQQISGTNPANATNVPTPGEIALRKELDAVKEQLKKSAVPAQTFNQPSGSTGTPNDEELNNRYGRGEIPWSPAVAAARNRLGYD